MTNNPWNFCHARNCTCDHCALMEKLDQIRREFDQSRGTLSQVKARQLVKLIQSDEPINRSTSGYISLNEVKEAAKRETANNVSSWGPILKKIFPDQPTQAAWLDELNIGEPEDCDQCDLHQCRPECINSVRFNTKIRVSSP